MLPEEIFARVGGPTHMHLARGRIVYDFILNNHLHDCLWLGLISSASTAYAAGAIQDLGLGKLVIVDRELERKRVPSMETVLQEVNLTHMLEIHYEPNSFNWYLMKMLEANRHESFDLCYIGGQTWYETGLGFCLVERLLRPGGWVVFDNLFFSFQESNNMGKSWVKKMPKEEQVGRQVEKVFELLVETDPHFGSFRRIGSLGFAQKLKTFWSTEQRDICREAVNISRAIALAYSDSKYRHELLECPDQALSALTGLPCSRFQKLRFIESDHYGPIPHTVNETGTTIVHLEREAPSRILTLMELVKMLVSRVWNKQNECKE